MRLAGWDEGAAVALSDELIELAGHLNAIHVRVTRLIASALDNGLWEQAGVTTPEQFVAWKLGVSPEFARQVVRVARHRTQFPTAVEAFDGGELSVEQTAVAVKAPAWADAQIVDIARVSTVAKLRVQMRPGNFEGEPAEQPESPAPTVAPPSNTMSFGITGDGRWRFRGSFDIVTGKRIEAAITERRDALFTGGDEDVTWADATADCFDRSLDSVESPSRRDRYDPNALARRAEAARRLLESRRAA